MEPTATHKMTGRKKLGLWLLIAPTGLWVVTFVGYAIVNFALAAGMNSGFNSGADLFATQSAVSVIANIVFFLTGTVAFITWLPGLIVGIILLVTNPQHAQAPVAQQPQVPQPPQPPQQ